ncbi:GNAT family N-acetyltransferase [Piscirickettsia litoralis]|uniref:N-acetyltransferase domain-containing protein n=1 Tax=Piscirickettsia litoralis TaxID=1891921 RepID=A0ABX3A721_9GAMM|nr:GNAT family N-acetyltransferase [Piscirickettsia litoralis]ODN43491.1 hypothetical protein BGC07_11895 [Piscirickettsia litoralis]
MFKIREYCDDDLNHLQKVLSQPSNYQQTFQLPAPSSIKLKQQVSAFLARENHFIFMLEHIDHKKVIGRANLYCLEPPRHHSARFGFNIDEDYQNIGAGNALLEELINFSQNKLNLKKLVLTVYTDNNKAINLYKKFNFREDGLIRKFAFRDGKYVDAYHMSLELN